MIIEKLSMPLNHIEREKRLVLHDDDLTDMTTWVWAELPDDDEPDAQVLALGRDDESLADIPNALQFDNIAQAIEYRRYLDNEPVFMGLTLTLVEKEV